MVNVRWRFGIIAGIMLALCAMFPQMKMWYLRGADWQGAYAYNDIDEVAYAAYLRALIDGRSGRNDPYSGRDDTPEHPQEESLFSIQFAAPYTAAIPARIFGYSASTAMWLTGAFAAFIAGLALFRLFGKITDNEMFAMAGTLIVVCGGALAAGEGAIGELRSGYEYSAYPYFPGLRRYVPAIPFAVFFIMCGAVWSLVATDNLARKIIYAVIAALCFAFTVFSYFYIWTTAAAWLACLTIIWLIARPEDWRSDFKALIALGAGCVLAMIPYAILLSARSHTMDDVQLLVYTRMPDLWRVPELISYTVILMILLGALLKSFSLRDKAVLFTLSLASVPIAVFNQQVITGRSLQPIHYQVFIGNYVAALALVLTAGLLFRNLVQTKITRTAFACLALAATVWGFVECFYTVRVLDDANLVRDEGMPVARRLTELAAGDIPSPNANRAVTLAYSMVQSDDLPTIAPQAVLWARHQHVFPGLTWEENKERYYQYLYYSDLDESWLENGLIEGDFVSSIALFGWGRHTTRLSSEAKPLTYGEVREEAKKFGEYRKNFGLRQASNPTLSYVVVPDGWQGSFNNLDTWYERDAGEKIGKYTLYKVKLKTPAQ